ncbi:MAG: hypothetical protein V1892_00055 [bacterium]
MLFNFFDQEAIKKHLKELSQGESKIKKIIEEEMEEVIKENHPDDFQDFIKRNEKELNRIKSELKEKYFKKLQRRIANLIS